MDMVGSAEVLMWPFSVCSSRSPPLPHCCHLYRFLGIQTKVSLYPGFLEVCRFTFIEPDTLELKATMPRGGLESSRIRASCAHHSLSCGLPRSHPVAALSLSLCLCFICNSLPLLRVKANSSTFFWPWSIFGYTFSFGLVANTKKPKAWISSAF